MDNGTDFVENGHSNGATQAPATGNATLQMDYTADFPSLPIASAPVAPAAAWSRPVVASKNIVQTFVLASDERANKVKNFGSNDEQKKCQQIAQSTGTHIEISESKDGSLTVVVKGLRNKVDEARNRIVKDLQTQASREIDIPKDHHRKLIGQQGAALKQLEAETNCKISIPNRDTPSSIIKIVGPREGIEKACAHIRSVSEREAKLAQDNIVCPRVLYPFIRGPFNENFDKLVSETGAKINIPPSQATNEIITISGEKDGVHKAAAAIRAIIAGKQDIKSVTCTIARAQHRYVIGQQRRGIHEVMQETGVSVEVPNEEENSDVITLRGDPSKLGEALALVYAKASSVITQNIECPVWLHKHLIGPKGSTLQALVPNRGKAHIDFDDAGRIFLEGSPEDVKAAHTALSNETARLLRDMSIEKVKVHPTLHRHVIGRGGAFISKIKEEAGVQISIPNEQTNSDEIVVEGKKEGVKKAVQEIKAIVSKIENEKSKDIIIEQRLHKLIIGTKGSEVGKIREKYPNVSLNFPDANKKSDVVNIRGDKNEVDNVYKILQKIAKDLIESNYQQSVSIFKEFHKNIIGKGGATVKKIREETQTRIDLPDGNSGEDKILVTGKKENVEKAIEQLNKIQNELASIVSIELEIPVKVQSRLLGGGRRLIHDIQEECGGVHINFPAEKSESTKVTVRGPQADAEKAEKLLSALAKDKGEDLLEDTVKAKAEYQRFLIGKGGSKINKLREKYDVRVMFPREGDSDLETIHLLGKKADVENVKQELAEAIKQLNETVEIKVDVDSKHHKAFLVRGAALLKEIQEQNGGVQISFPRAGEGDSVTIKGSKQCAESAKLRIEDIVEDIEKQITVEVDIPHQYHRQVLANRGQKVQEIQSAHNVQIRFPKRDESAEAEPSNVVTISGRDTKCEAAREDLLALVPIQKIVNVPVEAHRMLIGRGGETVRKLMQDHDVNVSIPKDNASDEITVTGQSANVDSAIEEIKEKMVQYEADAEDRKLKSWKLEIEVSPEYHQRIIGPKGSVINSLRDQFDVQISLPRGEESVDKIVIQGYEEKAKACAAAIEEMISEIRSLFTQEISLDARFHPRLIGVRGKNLKKIQEDYRVEIRFPRESADPNLCVIAGKSEDDVYDCIDHLKNEEEEWLQDYTDRDQYQAARVPAANSTAPKPKNVTMKNAPWQMDIEQFPDMGTASQNSSSSGAWGAARRW